MRENIKASITMVKNIINLKGCLNRLDYWTGAFTLYSAELLLSSLVVFVFFGLLIKLAITLEIVQVGVSGFVLGVILLVAIQIIDSIIRIPAAVRRLHDVNKSGWFFFISAIPYVGIFLLTYFLLKSSIYDGNEFRDEIVNNKNFDYNACNSDTGTSAGIRVVISIAMVVGSLILLFSSTICVFTMIGLDKIA